MFEQEGSWNLSFSGSGFMGLYHVGVITCLRERAPRLLWGARRVYGSSSGTLGCLAILCNKPAEFCCCNLMDLVNEARKNTIGIYHPSFDSIEFIKRGLQEHLPDNIHELASQKLGISLTRWRDGENVIITHFASRDELIQATLCSVYCPLYCGNIPLAFRGERYLDGALSNNVPFSDSKDTITISPFHGTVDICPDSPSPSLHELNAFYASFQICKNNLHHAVLALFPPEPEVVADICRQGYLDALRFLETRGLTKEGVIPRLLHEAASFPGSKIWPVREKQGTSGCDGAEKKSGLTIGGKAPFVMVKDIAKFELLSPELEAALKKSCEKPSGLLVRFSRSLPGQVLAYALLPCTLPFEYAYFRTKRLINWIPDAPDDILWMHGELKRLSSFVFSEVKNRLLGSTWEPRADLKHRFIHEELKGISESKLQNLSSSASSNERSSLPSKSRLWNPDRSKMHISLAEIVLPPEPLRA